MTSTCKGCLNSDKYKTLIRIIFLFKNEYSLRNCLNLHTYEIPKREAYVCVQMMTLSQIDTVRWFSV